jgi:hypothetical protein
MSSQSVTGVGLGSAEYPLRGVNFDPRKININAAQIGDGTISNEEFSYLSGLTGNVQEQINAGISVPNVVSVTKSPSDIWHGSIATAVASITDSSELNRYVVRVGPGIYYEPEITLPPFVFVVGDHIDTVVIVPNGSHHIFRLGNRSGLVNLTLEGTPTFAGIEGVRPTGFAGIYSEDIGAFATIHKVTITNCYYGVYHKSLHEDSYLNFLRNTLYHNQ